MPIMFETERLIVKPMTLESVEQLYSLFSDPDVMKYIGNGVRTREETKESVENSMRHYEKHGFSLGDVYERSSGKYVGRAGLVYLGLDDTQPEIEVGYQLHKAFWGKGYATELTKAFIQFGFEELTLKKVVAVIKPGNEASRRVLEKSGMHYVGESMYKGFEVEKFSIMKNRWLERWENNIIGFHLSEANPLLIKYWPTLDVTKEAKVFVPLCGKTLDLLWLAQQGHHVMGVELSDIACEAFFIENKLEFKKEKIGNFVRYYNDHIEIYCGDFFDLTPELFSSVVAIYDRAALIALPKDLRERYVAHLQKIIFHKIKILLITYDSKDNVQGPPYPVSSQEIKELFGERFVITKLAHFQIQKTDIFPHLQKKGYHKLYETVYRLVS